MATKSAFPGFPEAGIQFLRELQANNDREWFAPRKSTFEEQVKAPMLALLRAVHTEMIGFAPAYVGDPAKCLFRIYRDTRFSNDKTPYKTHVAAWMKPISAEKGSASAGFYVSVSPKIVEIAGGIYAPDNVTLLKLRQHVGEDYANFRAQFGAAKFLQATGGMMTESLTRAPKGFDPAHPALDLIRLKHFVVFEELDPAIAVTAKLLPELVKRFTAMAPFVLYLNGALAAQRMVR